MNYVQTILSSARYAMAQNESGFTPPSDIELCLVEGIGICGHHIKAFVEIMAGLGIPAREVEIYYADEHGERFSHIVAEIEWDGAWHMFDVTWGSCLMMAIR